MTKPDDPSRHILTCSVCGRDFPARTAHPSTGRGGPAICSRACADRAAAPPFAPAPVAAAS